MSGQKWEEKEDPEEILEVIGMEWLSEGEELRRQGGHSQDLRVHEW